MMYAMLAACATLWQQWPNEGVWSLHTINKVLCALGGKVQHQKVRESRRKVTKYQLKKGL